MPKPPSVAARIDLARARLAWADRQGLRAPGKGDLPAVVARTGWVRTLGGADVYLAVRSRVPGLRRADLEAQVEARALQVVPAVRGCIYLVPRAQVPLVMRVAEEQSRPRVERDMAKLGVTDAELAEVGEAAVAALAAGPLPTDALRKALPAGVVRSLGEAGKKLGVSSTLPNALRVLEFAGRIERTLLGGRLDTERYAWRLAPVNPFADADVPGDLTERLARVASAFLLQGAPATVAELATWAGVSQKVAREALGRVPAVPVAVDGHADEAWVPEADLAALLAAAPSGEPRYTTVPFEDNHVTLHGGPGAITDAAFHALEIDAWGRPGRMPLGEATHISHRGLLRDGALVGFWEMDPDADRVVWATFAPVPAHEADAIALVAEETAALLREVGHAKSFSLDSTDAVRARAAKVRALGA